MLYSARELRCCAIVARDGEIGTLDDLYFDDAAWIVRYLVVDTGGWITGKKVIVSPDAFGPADLSAKKLPVSLTREQVESSPDIMTEQTVAAQHLVDPPYFQGWPAYWGPGSFLIPSLKAPPVINPDETHPEEPLGENKPGPHLRSAREVSGYRIQARDEGVGHVDDLLVDPETWTVRYLVVDTRNWLPGRRVLLSWQWVDRVRWWTHKVYVDLPKSQIADSPEYKGPQDVTREYELELHRHFERPGYWRSAGG